MQKVAGSNIIEGNEIQRITGFYLKWDLYD